MTTNYNFYFITYKNYFNRIQEKNVPQTLSEYLAIDPTYYSMLNIYNFNIGDGVMAYVNTKDNISGIEDIGKDYCVITDQAGNILHRWYVIETVLIKAGQFQVTLRRDVISDKLDKVLASTAFIEKGLVSSDNPLIFNSERMTYNQIKTNQYLLKGFTNSLWCAAFINQSLEEDATINFSSSGTKEFDIEVSDINNSIYTQNQNTIMYSGSRFNATFQYQGNPRADKRNTDYFYNNHGSTITYTGVNFLNPGQSIGYKNHVFDDNRNVSALFTAQSGKTSNDNLAILLENAMITRWKSETGTLYQNSFNKIFNSNNPMELNNKKILDDKTGNIYQINVNISSNKILDSKDDYLAGASYTAAYALYKSGKNFTLTEAEGGDYWYNNINTASGDWITAQYYYQNVSIGLTLLGVSNSYKITIPASRGKIQNQPYDIMVFPLSGLQYSGMNTTTNPDYGESAYNSLIKALSKSLAAKLIDIQIFPYCPFPKDIFLYQGKYKIPKGFVKDKDYIAITNQATSNATTYGYCYFLTSPDFTFTLDSPLNLSFETDPIEKKIKSETQMIRICSPNYQGLFEFNPQKNNGFDTLTVSCTLKPYNSFCNIQPNFKNLYGQNFQDYRGMRMAGNMSISRSESAWENYELNNKNYQNIFNREIQNLDFHNAMAMTQDVVNTVSSSIGGAVEGFKTGGVIGAAVQGGTQAALGAGNAVMNAAARAEDRNLKFDMFGYQLGNIKALPNSITNIDIFDIQNPKFPYIEVYDCTDTEKNALRNKIKFNGMTLMIVDNLEYYIINAVGNANCNYVKAQIIRFPKDATNDGDDAHIRSAIYGEINQGLYWYNNISNYGG